jgi:hypothetical protein
MTEKFEYEIENGSVVVEVMFASTPNSLLRRLEDNPLLQEARRELSEHPEYARRYLTRAEALLATPSEEGFLSNQDQPLAAYLYLLGSTGQREAHTLIQRVAASNRADLHYARWVADYWVAKATVPKSLAGVA